MLQNHLGQYERGEFRSKFSQKLQNFVTQLLKIAILIKKNRLYSKIDELNFEVTKKLTILFKNSPKYSNIVEFNFNLLKN